MKIRVLSSGEIFSSGDFYSSENHRLLDNPLFFPQTKILIPHQEQTAAETNFYAEL